MCVRKPLFSLVDIQQKLPQSTSLLSCFFWTHFTLLVFFFFFLFFKISYSFSTPNISIKGSLFIASMIIVIRKCNECMFWISLHVCLGSKPPLGVPSMLEIYYSTFWDIISCISEHILVTFLSQTFVFESIKKYLVTVLHKVPTQDGITACRLLLPNASSWQPCSIFDTDQSFLPDDHIQSGYSQHCHTSQSTVANLFQ